MRALAPFGASLMAFAWSNVAVAQAPEPGQAAMAAQQPTTTGRTGTADDQDAAIGDDIVVTAQRRAENLMQTSVSASVLSGADLANKGVLNVDALQFATPSVVVNNFGQGNNFNVRGIGKAEGNTQTTTGVITYRDGVPSFPGYFQQEPYFDVANIQVLRGPQGTIVGQNATGGAVFVNTNDPVVGGKVTGYVQGQIGNYADVGLQGAVNLPVSDTLAVRVALFGERRDGFYNITGPARKDANNDLRMAAGRISILWKPIEGLSILSKTDVDYLDMGAYPASPFLNNFRRLPGTNTPNPNYRDLFDISANSPQEARDKFIRSILKIDYEFEGGLKLRSVSGIQNGNTRYRADLDGTATGNLTFFDNVTETQFTQEFNVISPDNRRLTYIVGAFGVWNTYFFLPPFQFVTGAPAGNPRTEYRLDGRNPTRSLAAFAQIGFEITPDLKLEAGGRYTDSKSTNYVDVLQYGVPLRSSQETSSNNFSYKVSLGWKVNPNHYLYGFVATGFRPGGLNVPVGLGNPAPFEPEEVTSYEAGWKATLLDGKLRTTLTGFYNDYKNFQVTIGYPDFPTFGIELNVRDKTRIYGAEVEAELRLGRFSLNAGANVLHSSVGRFFAVDPRVPPIGAAILPCNPQTGPARASCIDLKGREQTYAPNFTFNAGAEYRLPVGDDTIVPRVNYGHVAPQWATLFENNALGDRLDARNIVNAQLAWEHDSFIVTAYATNLFDQHYPGALNSRLYFAGPPQQYGVKLFKSF